MLNLSVHLDKYKLIITTNLIAMFILFGFNNFIIQDSFQVLPINSDDYQVYNNIDHGISIQYPINWIKEEGGMIDFLLKGTQVTPIVIFKSPDSSVNLFVGVEKFQNKMKLDQYIKENIDGLKVNQPNIKIIQTNSSVISGTPATTMTFKGDFNFTRTAEMLNMIPVFGDMFDDLKPINTTTMQTFTIHNDKVYILAYSDAFNLANKILEIVDGKKNISNQSEYQDKFVQYLPVAQKMIFSFDINKSKTDN